MTLHAPPPCARIIVIEDSLNLARLYREEFLEDNLDVDIAVSASMVEVLLKQCRYQLAVLDVHLR